MIVYVESAENKIVKHIIGLRRTSYRKKCGQFLVEGARIVREAIEFASKNLRYIIISRRFFAENEEYVAALKQRFKIYELSDKIFEQSAGTKTPQGIMAVLEKIKFSINLIENEFLLILDGIKNPGNMGTIIRTAEAAGIDAIIALDDCVDATNPKSVRASMGSIFRMKIFENISLDEVNAAGFHVIAADIGAEKNFTRADFSGKIAIIIGSEDHGLNTQTLKLCDETVNLPMKGRVESLNAAETASILTYFAAMSRAGLV
jgi:TrmH family RNA methyltransferase